MNQALENDEIEIDLKELFYALKKKIVVIIGAFIAGVVLMAGYTIFLVTPMYSASSMIYVLSRTTESNALSDVQLGTQLTNDYKIFIKTRLVIEQVIENTGVNMSYEQLANAVTVSNPTDSRILTITVTNPDPATAQLLANEIASVTADTSDVTGAERPSIVEEAVLPEAPVSPSLTRNCALGGIAGLAIACVVIIVLYLLNDTIKSEEDIERHLHLTTLGVIPMKNGRGSKKKQQTTKKRGGKVA